MKKEVNIKINNKMKKELNSLWSKANNVIDLSLLKLLKDGFILSNGCTFFRFLFEKAHVSFTDFFDMTGYECFVNKFCVNDFLSENYHSFSEIIYQGLLLMEEIKTSLQKFNCNENYRLIMSIDKESGNVTIRFHTLRLNEVYIKEPLDEYEQPILIVDINESNALQASIVSTLLK